MIEPCTHDAALPPDTMSSPGFVGVVQAINQEPPAEIDVTDDAECEQETLINTGSQMAQLQDSLRDASKGVSDSTDSEYRRFVFCIK